MKTLLLYAEAVRGSRKSIPQVVKAWVECYEKDRKPAMLDLLSMLFEVIEWPLL